MRSRARASSAGRVTDDPADPIYRGLTPVKETGYLTDRLGEETCAFIRKNAERPFFAYLAFNAVHAPLQAPAAEIAKFKTGDASRDARLAMGKRMDDAIGAIVATLKQQGRRENTLTFFLSDNGGPLAQSADNTPLRGGKPTDYEGGVRVPFLVCWPAQLQPGESQAVVSSLDILPTALAACGLTAPAEPAFDGLNLLPILRGETPAPPRDLFWCNSAAEGWWAIRSGDWKVVSEKGRLRLFDLAKDPGEATDLSAQQSEQLAALTAKHDAWLVTLPAPLRGGEKKLSADSAGAPKARKMKKKDKEA